MEHIYHQLGVEPIYGDLPASHSDISQLRALEHSAQIVNYIFSCYFRALSELNCHSTGLEIFSTHIVERFLLRSDKFSVHFIRKRK